MKPFQNLTYRGQVRRLRQLANLALDHYNLDVREFQLVGWFTNLLFRVTTAGEKSFVLRICAPGWRTDLDLISEAIWLEALQNETDIGAPLIFKSREGKYLVNVRLESIPGERRCILMSWIPGTRLGKQLNEKNLNKMGILFARLHQQAESFVPPEGFTPRKMDRVLARDEVDFLFSESCQETLTAGQRDLMNQVQETVAQVYTNLYAHRDGLRVIHHDLWHDNIHIFRGKLHPLDFEDTCWGYPVQDLAMALQDLMNDVEAPLFEPFQAALRHGYENLASWPESYPGQIDVLRAGRMLWVANYVAGYQTQHLQNHLESIQPMLRRYLDTGKLRKTNTN